MTHPDRQRRRWRFSTQQRLLLTGALVTALALAVQYLLTGYNPWLSSTVLLAGAGLCYLQQQALRPLQRELQALNLHAQNLQDGSFNTAANQMTIIELASLAQNLNQMSAQLRSERASLYQRELLLDTVLQTSPTALVLTDEQGTVLMANPAARQLLHHGKAFAGSKFAEVLHDIPALAQAVATQQQGLQHLPDHSIWHLSVSQFQLNQRRHNLYLLKPMTREIQREELTAWKKLLRVIGHELNNTLAPLSSLAFSGEAQAKAQQQPELAALFATLSERSQALNQFVQAYIRFAKLPAPEPAPVNWPRLINQLQDLYEFDLIGDLPVKQVLADSQQLQQALLNILKNAHESGSDASDITLMFRETVSDLTISIQDAGGGMTAEQLQHALVPFYTSKQGGSGIGLTLCRDIAEGHGGSLSLQNYADGLKVNLTLPLQSS